MALQTKTFYSGYYGTYSAYRLYFELTEVEARISDNKSKISYVIGMERTSSNRFNQYRIGYTVILNGVTVKNQDFETSKSTGFDSGVYKIKIFSGEAEVIHNDDGTLNMKFEVSIDTVKDTRCPGPMTISGSWKLTDIPRASSFALSTSSVNVNSPITATISRVSSNFTHSVEFYINSTYYQSYTGVGTSKTFTVPEDWYNYMTTTTSCTAYCRVTTYNNGTQIGSPVTKSFTVTVPNTVVPTVGTITLDPHNINGQNILVQNKNKITVSVSECYAGKGSSIKSYTFSGPGISYTGSSTSVTSSGNISTSGTLTYTVTVTDNRGRTSSKQATINCYTYASPYFISFNAYRADKNGEPNLNGTYLKCDYSTYYEGVNSTNKIDVKIYYNGTETQDTSINLNGDTDTTYSVYAVVTDSYGGSGTSSIITVFGQARILNITKNGTGVAIGKMSEIPDGYEGLFECRWPSKFDDDVEVDGSAEFNGSVTFNGEIYGLPEQEQYLLPTASKTTLGGVKIDGSTVTINNGVISAKQYSLPTASTTQLGGVKVDNASISISNGVISAKQQSSISEIFNNSSSTSASCSFTPSNYSLIICGLTPSSYGTVIFTTLPAAIASNSVTFQVADETSYCRWTLSSSGLTRSNGDGYIKYIYGVKL